MTDRATQLLIEAGEIIFLEGEPATTAFLIEHGEVEISIERAGRRVVLARRGAGEVIGEMAVIDDKPRSASARAVQSCELVPISADQLARRIDQTDPVLRMCLSVILDRFRATLAGVHALEDGSSTLVPCAAPPSPTGANGVAAHAAALHELKVERELRDALRRNEFELHFQPIIALRSGRLAGFEALLRWRHPIRGVVAPGSFIPTAEASGLIVDIGRWIVREACMASHRLAALAAPGAVSPDGLFMSINVSGRDIADPTFVDRLRATLDDTATNPQRIKLEITESLLIDQPDRAAATLARCKEVGVSIAIDDFGTGYGSMSYLHQFPIDTLKIDRSFVTAMGRTETSRAIVRSIVGLGRDLQLPVVAEGVEQLGEARDLRTFGCTYGQGFLYAKPLNEGAAVELVGRWQGNGRHDRRKTRPSSLVLPAMI